MTERIHMQGCAFCCQFSKVVLLISSMENIFVDFVDLLSNYHYKQE